MVDRLMSLAIERSPALSPPEPRYLVISVAHFVARRSAPTFPIGGRSDRGGVASRVVRHLRAEPFQSDCHYLRQRGIACLSYLEQMSGWSIHCNP